MAKSHIPPQHQDKQPGVTREMTPKPVHIRDSYRGSGKLEGKKALITGGDSGIGRAVALHFAREGAEVAVLYLDEHEDAKETKRLVEAEGRRCITLAGDVGDESFCRDAVARTVEALGGLDVVVNNAAEQHQLEDLEKIEAEQVERTFRTNVFGYFYVTKHALPHLKEGASIINTTSVTAYKGNPMLVDYSATKGAIVAFTRALAQQLGDRKVRVNGVAPGPVWTPLIPASFDEEKVEGFGEKDLIPGPAHPADLGPTYVFLACEDSSFYTGQVLHPNGGRIVNA